MKRISYFMSSALVKSLFFNFRDVYRTEKAYVQITDRYKESIKDVNQSLSFNIGFTIVAVYVYFILPPNNQVEVPFIGLAVSREVWISLAPAISFGLQIFIITSFIWFMALRSNLTLLSRNEEADVSNVINMLLSKLSRGTRDTEAVSEDAAKKASNPSNEIPLHKTPKPADEFPDFTNLLLNGSVGHLWMIFRIRALAASGWHYLWYLPVLSLAFAIIFSPLVVCIFFIIQLFLTDNFGLGIIYSMFFVPYSILFTVLMIMVAVLIQSQTDITDYD